MLIKKTHGSYKILNSKERKNILKSIQEQWGCDIPVDDPIFLMNPKQKLFLTSRDIESLNLAEFRVDKIGTYFGMFDKNGLRLSIEGSQIIGPCASKNVIELNRDQIKDWLQGVNIDFKFDSNSFVIIKHDSDFMGCAKSTGNVLMNFVPKARRVKIID
ncbi:hypothetical protein HOK51_07355 [Candidatus Woesearchaeota archaeon]|jgi:NOL1/NOP2/fmu family ribosome biogenesis protein|nr:hypothetical protein [Candidatus Woesearchaeota archaeon]MBT6519639.1 hypothetical protein [Candidatus Woesearchaeota archaeon]MBT7367554.1 hypothetical protein [Candidatus Woesearchaeota archaeon]